MRLRRVRYTLLVSAVLLCAGGAITLFRPGILSTVLATPFTAPDGGARGPVERPLPPVPDSLKTISPAAPPEIDQYVRDQQALVLLGKALFWDMNVGSDGVQSCATCHFHAGADVRITNQINPGPDSTFQAAPPNGLLTALSYPFHKLADPDDKTSAVLADTDDRTSSMGAQLHTFVDVTGTGVDEGTAMPDPIYTLNGLNTRRVEPRNAPTVINSAFFVRNFWDGRADRTFNGVNPFGDLVDTKILMRGASGTVDWTTFKLHKSSLASQAVGPPMSFFEMSFDGRSFAKLGKKLVGMRGLATQKVAPDDSVLGAYRDPSGRGIIPTYGELVRQAFVPALWDSEQVFSCTPNCSAQPNCDPGFVTIQPPLGQGGMLLREQFTLMQMNFSVFFGVAIQAYERTLISDDAPFDRYREGDSTALTDQQKHGLSLFSADARCISCHKGPDFTGAGFTLSQEELEGILIERMAMNDGGTALYDNGFYNIGVRPPSEDVGLGGTAPNGKPLSFVRRFVSGEFNEMNICNLQVPFASTNCFVLPPLDVRAAEDTVVDGTFKTPSLRNVELTGPYFHNGGQATLSQVVHFYNRGGDFTPQDESIRFIGLSEDEMADIVAFLKSLTDDRVRYEKAPFDHPELCIPDGHPANELPKNGSITATTLMLHVPAVGRNGGPALSSYEELLNGTGAKHTDGPCAPRGTP